MPKVTNIFQEEAPQVVFDSPRYPECGPPWRVKQILWEFVKTHRRLESDARPTHWELQCAMDSRRNDPKLWSFGEGISSSGVRGKGGGSIKGPDSCRWDLPFSWGNEWELSLGRTKEDKWSWWGPCPPPSNPPSCPAVYTWNKFQTSF